MTRKFNSGVIQMSPDWLNRLGEVQCGTPDGYVPARPVAFQSLMERVRATWLVWSGQADALVWPGGQ